MPHCSCGSMRAPSHTSPALAGLFVACLRLARCRLDAKRQQLGAFLRQNQGVSKSSLPQPAALVFDACRVGVVLRAVMLVVLSVLAAGFFFSPGHHNRDDWFMYFGTAIGCALPATLLWLMLACVGKRWLARQTRNRQWWLGIALGVGCGAFAAGILATIRDAATVPWAGCMLAGGLFAAQVVSMLMLRSQLQAPGNVQAQLAELQARIRPHFLFNALNSAIALVRTDPHRAELVLENLSDVFRQMLQDVRHSSTLGQELELARRYLAVEEVRFGERLRLQWELDPAANLASMPALILQPLLENAIRHGVEPSPHGADIAVRTMLRGNVVRIIVSNTMPAGPGKPGNGLALENVRRRLHLLHDVELRFSAKAADGRFNVRIEVPMRLPEVPA